MSALETMHCLHAPSPQVSWEMIRDARNQPVSNLSWLELLEADLKLPMRTLIESVADTLGLRVIGTSQMLALVPRFDRVSLAQCLDRNCVLLASDDGSLQGVHSDPLDTDLQTWLTTLAGVPVNWRLALATDIHAYLTLQEQKSRAVDSFAGAIQQEESGRRSATLLSFATVSQDTTPAVRLVNSTLYDALRAGASDIHLESSNTGLIVKYRVDGVLDTAATVSGVEVAEHVISRLKVLAELDISERRTPQDGSFRVDSNGREIDLRVSIIPSIHGEDAVIRILDKQAMVQAYGALSLEALGFDVPSLVTLRSLARAPHGMLLVTGPTGSGKTTTLYAALTEIHTGREKIITIEDPVEYQLPDILQIPVNEKKGLTFAKGLRSILRHDPDKIMIGEIRDTETAEIAVQSALTGHLVLTTVHANNVFDVFGRFTHMGLDPYSLVSALNGVWSQRLIRLVCPHCGQRVEPDEVLLKELGISASEAASFEFTEGQGCGDCRGTGYKGRKAVAEILVLSDVLREMIVDKRPIRQIKQEAFAAGTRSLRLAALDLARRGETTCAEVLRVTQHA